jgi:hypothetical protein
MALSKRAKGTLWIIVAIIIGIPILLFLVVLLRLDSIVRAAVEVGGTRALGVETRLKSANVSLMGRSITLKGLDVANPKGFTTPSFFKADLIGVSAEVSALRKKEIHLYAVTLDEPEITYEVARPKTNVAALMDNLNSNEQAPEPSGEKGQPVKLKIDKLSISNAKVHVIVFGKPLDVSLGTVVINNLDDGHGNAIPPGQILSAVLRNLTDSITNEVKGLPSSVTKDILPNIEKQAGGVGENLKNTGESIGSQIKKLFGN